MHSDIGHTRLMITRFPQRRPRAHLFAFSARHILLACAIIIGLVIGLGLVAQRAHSAPPAAPSVAARPPGA
jgi:hypothetical protein